MTINDVETVALVAHDAGGAEILSSYARDILGPKLYVLEGPAVAIFERKIGPIQAINLPQAIDAASWVICGTSWQSNLEWRALQMARDKGKRTVSFLDHWVNYRERFEHAGEMHLPDELWVADLHAEQIARACFSQIPIRFVGNPYFNDLISELNRFKSGVRGGTKGITLLYICEPISEHARMQWGNERHMGYVEEDAIKFFFHHINLISDSIGAVLVRPHPAEAEGKYNWVLEHSPVPAKISSKTSLLEDLAVSDVVVGCESIAMVVAILAKKRVICSIPSGGKPCALPYSEIESLQNLVAVRYG